MPVRRRDGQVNSPVDQFVSRPGDDSQVNSLSDAPNIVDHPQILANHINDVSQGSEGPRERPAPTGGPDLQGPGSGGPHATPPSPMQPTPMSGTPGGGMMPPMQPFQPMPSQGAAGLLAAGGGPARRSLFGSMGGLKGGGLGNPFDPQSNDASDPISSLIQSLTAKRQSGGFGSF